MATPLNRAIQQESFSVVFLASFASDFDSDLFGTVLREILCTARLSKLVLMCSVCVAGFKLFVISNAASSGFFFVVRSCRFEIPRASDMSSE